MSKPEAHVLLALVVEAVDDAVADAVNDKLVTPGGVDLDVQQHNLHLTRQRIALTVMAALRAAGLVAEDRPRPGSANRVTDRGLYDQLKSGFDEGREPLQGTSTDESTTKPEHYEQLQFPGMEDD